jgi:outer membrane protein OmpA-like peptidoglycan-associated protein
MTRRFKFLFILLVFAVASTALTAQPLASEQSSDEGISELTKDPNAYASKPSDMWELGLHAGYLGIGGDTPFKLPFAGFGGGISLRKSLGYTFSLRGDFMYGRTYTQDYGFGTGPANAVSQLTGLGYNATNPFVFNSETTYTSFGLQVLYSFTNIKFHSTAPKLGIYGIAGFGGFTTSVNFDAKGANGATYDYVTLIGQDILDYNNGVTARKDFVKSVRDKLSQAQDGDYETAAPVLKIGNDEVRVNLNLQVGVGVAYRLSDRISIAIEPQIHVTGNDFLDGRKFNSPGIASNGLDIPFYLPIRIGVSLGDTKKKSVPLWWVNPLDAPMEAIAANTKKKDAAEMLADKDNDGVPNLLDKEPDTPAGAEVDTRGVTLDSDKDGLPNHLDKEPYSPVGYTIDPQTGISQKPVIPKSLTKDEIIALGKEQGWDKSKGGSVAMNEWFLPMIHFDNDRYTVKPQSYASLGEVAAVMNKYPSITVVVEGHASSEASESYNNRLSYNRANAAIDALVSNYGIDRSRLILRYNGESEPLIKKATTNYMNRRVEFRVANGETEMSKPGK